MKTWPDDSGDYLEFKEVLYIADTTGLLQCGEGEQSGTGI